MVRDSDKTVFRLDMPATFKHLNVVSGLLTAVLEQVNGLEDREAMTYNVILAVHEICTNIVEHAYGNAGGRIKLVVSIEEESGRLVVELSDTGRSFNMAATPEPDLDNAPIRGYGLFIVHELMDEVTYKPGRGLNEWRLVKTLS